MKTKLLKITLAVVILLGANCQLSAQELEIPFQGKEYSSDKNYFRAQATAVSRDQMSAKNKAVAKARQLLASDFASVVASATNIYTEEVQVNNDMNFYEEFKSATSQTSMEYLTNMSVAGEKFFENNNGTYTAWVVIQMPIGNFPDDIDKTINESKDNYDAPLGNSPKESTPQDDKNSIDFEKAKFEEIFNAEMEKLEAEK